VGRGGVRRMSGEGWSEENEWGGHGALAAPFRLSELTRARVSPSLFFFFSLLVGTEGGALVTSVLSHRGTE